MNIEIRRACDKDIPHILEIAAQTIAQEWTHSYIAERLTRADTLFLIAQTPGPGPGPGLPKTAGPAQSPNPARQIAGFCVYRTVGDDGELLQISTDPAYRRLGIADALLTTALGYAADNNLARTHLEVRAGNTPAIALYKKHGFIQIRIRKAYYDNPSEDAIVMCRSAKGTGPLA